MSLEKTTLAGLKWTVLERFSNQFIGFTVNIILARLLLPAEFGVVATVAVILVLAAVITDGGMGSAIVQSHQIERKDISTVFFMNLAIALVIFAGLTWSSPRIADYFGEPVLKYVLPALALGIVISALGQTQIQMLQKNMEFSRLMKISLPGTVFGGGLGIAMALLGMGVWSLVGQRLAQTLVFTSLVWKICNPEWRPRAEFSFGSLKKLSGFSLARLTTTFIHQLTRNLQPLIIAKSYSMVDLAFYNRAESFQKQPCLAVTSSLNRVMFPVFAQIQHDNTKIRTALRRGIPILAFLIVPAMFWLIAVAEPLIRVLLTDKWIDSVPYLQIFPLLGISYCISAVKLNVINGKGLSKLVLILGIVKPLLQISVLLVTWRYGITAMLIGQIAVSWFNLFLNELVVSRVIGFSLWSQWWDWFPYVFTSLFACLVASWIHLPDTILPIFTLSLRTLIFGVMYLLLFFLLKLPGYDSIMLRSKGLWPKSWRPVGKAVSGNASRPLK